MAPPGPPAGGNYLSGEADTLLTRLSLAVWLVDSYTTKCPVGRVKVTANGEKLKAYRNLSGYYIFNDLLPGKYAILVKPDLYSEATRTVDVPMPDAKNPVVSIDLDPLPSYPFPPYATLVRGTIKKAATGEPAAGVTVAVKDGTERAMSDATGEFVLWFTSVAGSKTIVLKIGPAGIERPPLVVREQKTNDAGLVTIP